MLRDSTSPELRTNARGRRGFGVGKICGKTFRTPNYLKIKFLCHFEHVITRACLFRGDSVRLPDASNGV